MSNLLNNSVTLFTAALLATSLPPHEFGAYTVLQQLVMTGHSVLELGIGVAMVRQAAQMVDPAARKEAECAGFYMRLGIAILVIVGLVPIMETISSLLFNTPSRRHEVKWAILGAVAMTFWTFVRSVHQVGGDFARYGRLIRRNALIRAVALLALLTVGMKQVSAFIFCLFVAAPLLQAGQHLIGYARRCNLTKEVLQEAVALFRYGKWMFFSSMLYPLCFATPLYLLAARHDFVQSGVFGLGLTIATVTHPLNEAVRAYLLPRMAQMAGTQDRLAYFRAFWRWSPAFFGIIGVLVASGSWLVQLILGQKYPGIGSVTAVLAGATGIAIYFGAVNMVFHALNKPHYDTMANVSKLSLIVAAALWLVPSFGASGGAVAVAVGVVTGELLMHLALFRVLKRSVEGRDPESSCLQSSA